MATVNPVELQKWLSNVDYPASKQTLIDHARDEGADREVRETLKRLPDEEYGSPNDVSEALGRIS